MAKSCRGTLSRLKITRVGTEVSALKLVQRDTFCAEGYLPTPLCDSTRLKGTHANHPLRHSLLSSLLSLSLSLFLFHFSSLFRPPVYVSCNLPRANTLHFYSWRAASRATAMAAVMSTAIAKINSGFFLIASRQKGLLRGNTMFRRSAGSETSAFVSLPPPRPFRRFSVVSLPGFPAVSLCLFALLLKSLANSP